MEHPTIVLGVEMMDQDHLRIEKMFEAASHAPDEDLPALYRDIAKELAAHFAREEDFLRERQFPGLNCHLAQHNVLLAEMAHGEPPKSADRGVATAHAFCHATIGFVACNDDGSNGGGFS